MATDWQALAIRFEKEHGRTGISIKDWCDLRGLNLTSARRYIKLKSAKKSMQKGRGVSNAHKAKGAQNGVVKTDVIIKDQTVIDDKTDTDENNLYLDNVQNQKRNTKFAKGNQCARTHGHYAEFVTTDEDVARYSSSHDASLRDELHLTRMQHSNLLVEIKRIEHDLDNPTSTVEIRASLYESYAKFCNIAERKVARIESLENTLIVHEKYRIEMEKNKALTRKATLEADKLERDTSGSRTSLNDIYDEIIAMGSDGMMNKYC